MPWTVSFDAYGENFYPSKIDYNFLEANDPGPTPKGRGRRIGFATIRVPANIPNEDRIQYIVNLVLPLMPSILQAGADDCHLDIARYYSTQCNEALSAEQLALITPLKCDLWYSAYQVSEEEEIELQEKLENY